MATPYRTDRQIEQEYANAYAKYKAAQEAQANRQKARKDSEYDDTQRQGYVNYMQTKKDMPGYLANLGILGGGSETTALRADTNYQNAHQSVEKRRNADKTAIDNTLTDTLNQYKMVADENMRKEKQQENQLRIAYAAEQRRLAEERFAKTISGYGTVASIDAEIAAIKARNIPGEWSMKYPYLMARRNEIITKAAEAAAASGGGGGGGYRSTGGSGYTTTTSDSGSISTEDAINYARSVLKGFASGGSPSKKPNNKSKNKSSKKYPPTNMYKKRW